MLPHHRKSYIAINATSIATFAVALFLFACPTARAQTAVIPPGTGSQVDPYLISELGHLVWMGDTVGDSNGKYYSMTANIDASVTATWNDVGTNETLLEGFKPIGEYSNPDTTSFRGIFDGSGHTITGLTINRPDRGYVGLFGCVGIAGQLLNLGVVDCSISGDFSVGSLSGGSWGSVSNCYATGTVYLRNVGAGGLVGGNGGNVSNCHSAVTIPGATGGLDGVRQVGGLIGANSGSISNCYATGAISGRLYIGGLIGYNPSGIVLNCFATNTVSGGSGNSAGGLIGYNSSGTVSQCYATGDVNALHSVGGLVGYNYHSTMSQCYATGAVSGGDRVGGLIGYTTGNPSTQAVSNCYATGAVTGHYQVGGLVGHTDNTSISHCFAMGSVSGTGGLVGGLIGSIAYANISNSYWSMELSGCNYSAGGIAKTAAEMKKAATFTNWDFTTIWDIKENATHPWLRNLPQLTKLTINISGPGGVTVAPPPTNGTYALGDVVVLTATPNETNDLFLRWENVEPESSKSAPLVMDADKTITAVFQHGIAINSLADLAKIGNDPAYPLDGVYALVADIDASSTATWNDAGTDLTVLEGFKPIGDYNSRFTGIFDGNGHTIAGLVVNRPSTSYVGLFGGVGKSGLIRNLGMADAAIAGSSCAGSLVGDNRGTLSNCRVDAVVSSSPAGGLVGRNHEGTVSNCYAMGTVSGSYGSIGGLIGETTFSTVSNCYAAVAVQGNYDVGGLIGRNVYNDTVSNSYWDVQVSCQTTSAGGTGKTTAEMKQLATFTNWDFASIWDMTEGVTYPWLRPAPPKSKLTVATTGPGHVTIAPESLDGYYEQGTQITITAFPNEPTDILQRWEGAKPSDSTTITIVMDLSRTITVVFKHRIDINSLADLSKIGNDPDYPIDIDICYVLTTDIDASETATWNDPGSDTTILEGFWPIKPFVGIFDGKGHTISGLVINRPSLPNRGLFSSIKQDGMVCNLGMVGGAVRGNSHVGSVVGYNLYGKVINCFATGSVTATSSNAGGLVGYNAYGTVSNSYATGPVTGGSRVGGLVGVNSSGTIRNCYSTGMVTGNSIVGGLLASKDSYATVYNSYWDTQTSMLSVSVGGIGKTTAEMKQLATFIGWDFVNTWGIAENLTYPYLRGLDADGDGVTNGLDACPDTPPGTPVSRFGCAFVATDLDRDGDVDEADIDLFVACNSGPAISLSPGCESSDFDGDGDADQSDFGILQRCYSGENLPVAQGCMQ